MAFDDGVQKEKESEGRKSPSNMTLWEIETELTRLAGIISFAGQNASERTKHNCEYVRKWAAMGHEEFRRRKIAAGKIGIDVVSGAYTPEGAVRWPEDDMGNYLPVRLETIITLQCIRLQRIDFAKEKEAEEHQKAVDEGWVSPDGA